MKIQEIPIRNILHWFKRNYVGAESISNYLKEHPETDRRVGSLPFDWLRNLPKDEFASATENVDIALHDFAENSFFCPDFVSLSEILVKSLKNILKRDDIKITYEGQGAFKYCQKLKVGDYTYALSTFKVPTKDMYCAKHPKHGQLAEPQKVFWTYKNSPHGRTAKPFMARFCTYESVEGGYILSKFIDVKDKSRAKTLLNPLRDKFYPVFNTDNFNGKNSLNGICVDVGGIIENTSFKEEMKNKELERNLFVFLDRIDISARNRHKEAEKLLLEQIKEGKDIFKMDLRTLNGSHYDVREAIRIVRRLRAVHKLKTKLEAQGEYDYYHNLLSMFSAHYTRLLHWELSGLL